MRFKSHRPGLLLVALAAGILLLHAVQARANGLPDPGFEIVPGLTALVVTDATAAAQLPGLNGYAAALTNFRMIASHIADTETTVAAIRATN